MAFTPREITDKEFLVTMRGYDRAEVKAFLRAVAADTADLRAEVEASRDPVVLDEGQRDDSFAESSEATMFVQATETITAMLKTAQAEAHQTRIDARERSEEWLRWAMELAEIIVATAQTEAVLRTGQAVERAQGMLEEVRTLSEALVTAAEAGTEEMLTAAQKTSQVEAAREDLQRRLAFTQNILRDLIVLAGAPSALDRPPPTARLARFRGEAPREGGVMSAPDSR
jgi:DivIVA domain-containing protein